MNDSSRKYRNHIDTHSQQLFDCISWITQSMKRMKARLAHLVKKKSTFNMEKN